MSNNPLSFSPTLQFISEENKKSIFDASLRLMEKVGQQVSQQESLALLKKAGCETDGDLVKIPSNLVKSALKSVPNKIDIFNREGEHAMDLGGRRSYYGTGSDLIYRLEPGTQERHQCRSEDIAESARLVDALPNIDFVMSFAHPHELNPSTAYLASFRIMAENTVKPIVNTAEGVADLSHIWEISKVIRKGEEELKKKPYWIHYAEPTSPLTHPKNSLDKLLFCAEKEMPVIYSPAPISGSTAPMTIAGHVVQGLSECLFGLVIHQLKNPGTPFLMGMGAAVLDMATSQCSYNAPEYLMAYLTMVEMSKYLDIPNWGYAGTSDAQIPDQQATYEAGLLSFMSSTTGSNLNHDVGYLDFGRAGSLEMIVIMNDIIDQIRRIQKGVIIDDDQIALEVISEVAHNSHFLGHPHTHKHFRTTQWRPGLLTRSGHKNWVKDGKKTLLDRANEQMNGILDSYQPKSIEPETSQKIQDIIDAFDKLVE